MFQNIDPLLLAIFATAVLIILGIVATILSEQFDNEDKDIE